MPRKKAVSNTPAAKRLDSSESKATDWLEDDNLMLLACWARDGYTYQDVANKIGISSHTLSVWREKYPEINEALKKGREIIDYQVENALLKSALGYKTKEVRVTTTIRGGKTVEQVKEVLTKEQAPNVYAIQCWLFNRKPDTWKRNRDNVVSLDDEDTTVNITVTRANPSKVSREQPQEIPSDPSDDDQIDEEWIDEINSSVEIRKATEKEAKELQKKEKQKLASQKGGKVKKQKTEPMKTKVEEEDLDYWPDDWTDEDEGWE